MIAFQLRPLNYDWHIIIQPTIHYPLTVATNEEFEETGNLKGLATQGHFARVFLLTTVSLSFLVIGLVYQGRIRSKIHKSINIKITISQQWLRAL